MSVSFLLAICLAFFFFFFFYLHYKTKAVDVLSDWLHLGVKGKTVGYFYKLKSKQLSSEGADLFVLVTLCESGWCNRLGVIWVKFSATLVQASERLGQFSVCKSERPRQEIIMNLSARLRKHLPERNVSEGGHAESTPPFTPGLLSVRCSRLALREPRFSHTLYCAEEREREKNSERRFSGSETNRQAHDSAYALKTHTC